MCQIVIHGAGPEALSLLSEGFCPAGCNDDEGRPSRLVTHDHGMLGVVIGWMRSDAVVEASYDPGETVLFGCCSFCGNGWRTRERGGFYRLEKECAQHAPVGSLKQAARAQEVYVGWALKEWPGSQLSRRGGVAR